MIDSIDRLYFAVLAARDLDPETSRTAKLFQRGPTQMAKKLGEEAIEVAIEALNGQPDAVVRESADLLYNLTVLWASVGIRPDDVWREMDRREALLGIAEKLPKTHSSKTNKPRSLSATAPSIAPTSDIDAQQIVALKSPRPRAALGAVPPRPFGMDKSAQ